MRLSKTEQQAIVGAVKAVDRDAKIWLFGSRVDDAMRGGDIDIAVFSKVIGPAERRTAIGAICDAIGEQKIDMVVSPDGKAPFFQLALETGVPLAQ